ncbi:uncharacterized protein LOC112271139, partial [Brachypodium distachyon]|uniref:uncharacterized protein LOC112271139 n=1 Tax=Brachypodium distachyon TaxID=15368 RepID=UPI000D0D4597
MATPSFGLVSIDGRGMKSDPCPRVRPAIHGASLGPGPLLFVDLDSDGNYSCPLLPDDQEITVAAGDDYSSSTLDLQATASSTFPQAYNTSTRPILAQPRSDWGMEFYIRADLGGSIHTYPDVGGPLQSMEQVDDAIDRYLHERRHPTMSKPVFLCWPDGTRKRRTRSHVLRKSLEGMHNLVSAVVDQYNEDHNLLGDLAYNLKDVLHHESFREKKSIWYRHLNFTANTKGLDGLDCCIG